MSYKSARIKSGLSVAKVAEELGVTSAAVYQWETHIYNPRTPILIKLAKLYGVTTDELLQDDSEDT